MILLLMLFAVIWLYGMIVSAKRYSEGTVFALHLFGVQESVMLKGLLAVGVVMGHIQIFCMKPHDYPLVNQLAVFAQVGVFFFISGYGLVASYQSKPQTYLNGFLRHRLTKIVLPLGMATVLYLVERKYLLGTSGGVMSDTPLPFSWFCFVILLYYLAYYISLKISGNLKVTIFVMLLLTVACYIVMGRYLRLGDWWYRSTWGFNLGMIVKYYETEIKAFLKRCVFIVMLLVPFGLFCIYAAGHFRVDMEIQAIGFSLLIYLFVSVWGMRSNRCFLWLGKYSYEIYLCHPMVIAVYPLLGLNTVGGDLAYCAFLPILTLSLSVALYRACKFCYSYI